MSKWISVEDRFPANDSWVLLWLTEKDVLELDPPCVVGWWNNGKWEGEVETIGTGVSHWQPLPSPPTTTPAPAAAGNDGNMTDCGLPKESR